LFVRTRLIIRFFVLQIGVGAVTPILILSYLFWRGTAGRKLVAGVTLSALLILLNVIMMRFNVVIGGQEISKTGVGLLSYPWVFLGKEGVFAAASVLVAPMLLLLMMVRLFPPWHESEPPRAL